MVYAQSLHYCELLGQLLKRMHRHIQIHQSSCLEAEDQAVDSKLLSVFPGLLHKGSTGNIENLFLYVDFN